MVYAGAYIVKLVKIDDAVTKIFVFKDRYTDFVVTGRAFHIRVWMLSRCRRFLGRIRDC